MVNLYIFNESSSATEYGIGTYIRELTTALRGCVMTIVVLHLKKEIAQIHKEELGGIQHWSFPAPIKSIRLRGSARQNELYYRNIVYLLQLHIPDKRRLVFHLNNFQCGKLAEDLKNAFDCRVVGVAHFFEWGCVVYDNLHLLRSILDEEKLNEAGVALKKAIQEEKDFYTQLDRIICLSNYMYQILHQFYGINTSKMAIVPNGLTDCASAKGDRQKLRMKWNIPDGEKIILFAGRLSKMKGLAYLIEAFRKILLRYPQCRLVIAGGGDFEFFTKESQDVCTRVTYTGFLEKAQLYEWYCLADVGVTPSLFEPFGYVAVEMMMYGLPVVVTATSGLCETVGDDCGIKIPITETPEGVEVDTTLLSEKILYLLQYPDEAIKLGQNGRKRFLKEYTSEVFRLNMITLYNSIYNTGIL